MTIRVPALDDERCPHCGAENIARKVYVWRTTDERGFHLECDACAHQWDAVPTTAVQPR